ncbi:hypothetical protein DLAC_07554 [Tieghemostelium lacteum]|uniref:Uncharacterized protein n=1 Tax=Tieghemostelium lacteum TaxID=361077 RepID=A0A151ZD10_TIELA|nr:hypothetical protein DLAC_07554 [Tieghemostelium lacteum]|eukprot:KYQ91764.1 hypothetical protein DLAC_07554 [Tieghemostelium lacteum]
MCTGVSTSTYIVINVQEADTVENNLYTATRYNDSGCMTSLNNEFSSNCGANNCNDDTGGYFFSCDIPSSGSTIIISFSLIILTLLSYLL